jgi:hypothetical protein
MMTMKAQSFLPIILLLIASHVAHGQTYPAGSVEYQSSVPSEKPISFEQILERLINTDDTLIVYNHNTIDLGNFTLRKIDRLFERAIIDSGSLVLNKSLEFNNCVITGKGFYDLKMARISFNNCEIQSLSITNLNTSLFEISGGSLKNIKILNSSFHNLWLSNLRNTEPESGTIAVFKTKVLHNLVFEGNKFYQNIGVFASDLNNLRFAKNETHVTGMANNTIANEILFLQEKAQNMRIRKNTFSSRDSLRYTFDIECDKFIFIENDIYVPIIFADSKFFTRVEMANNKFLQPIDVHEVSFPEFGKYIPFSQFEKGLVVYENLYGEDSPDGANCYYCQLYNGITDEELADKTNFDKLVQSYEILFQGYKSSGDIESANLSYIRIKDLYLNRLGYLYRTNGGFKHYFRWKLAQLLKFYTNHGTDPALSIVISIYVILIFSVFYVFYPSEWDITSKARLIANFKDFVHDNDKGYLAPFLALIAGFGISIINAITLSLNSFVTLGFGTIPTTGAARYVCILQGFIGWFLLSIFTVSLINQILF